MSSLSAPLLQAGMNALKAGRTQEAVTRLQQAANADPSCYEAWAYLGAAHTQLHDYENARQEFGRALQLRPESAKAWYNLGVAHHRAGDEDAARTCYESAIERDPGYTAARDALARIASQPVTMSSLSSPGGAVRLSGAHTEALDEQAAERPAGHALTPQEIARLSTPQGQFHMMGAQAGDVADEGEEEPRAS
ncbi:MAG: tetratricopeptide repeat protein [Chthonomonadales bacterium]|nr:tetratricopeptide repeat protein [Chthonomonadales bacterium]